MKKKETYSTTCLTLSRTMIKPESLDDVIADKLSDSIFSWLLEQGLVDSPFDAMYYAQMLAKRLKGEGWQFHPWVPSDVSESKIKA